MKIRAITIGQNIPFFSENETLESFLEGKYDFLFNFCIDLKNEFKKCDLEVETTRICSQPILSNIFSLKNDDDMSKKFSKLNQQLKILQKCGKKANFDYFSSCIMLADENNEIKPFEKLICSEIPNALFEIDNFFSSLMVSSTKKGINLNALKYCAKIIKKLSHPEPFNNLKFCVSTNVKPDTPFFPAAYHLSEKPKFSLALEMADEVVNVFEKCTRLSQAQQDLKKKFYEIYNIITTVSEKVSNKYNIEFHGIDFSPAPYPKIERSIGTAVEKLMLDHFGAHGSLIAIAIIKNSIPKKEKVIGFSGFMQPVLEDFTIAKRLSENKFSLESLLLYSTICGTGLDCVPLPGDITERELFYILLDLCTISITHDKPLTARLMPISGKKAGDEINFNFEYFASSKVMDVSRSRESDKKDLFYRDENFFNFY